jgi:phosphohistidine phosphatase
MPALGDPEVLVEERLYGASRRELLDRLLELPDRARSVLLIGHLPAIQELAVLLTRDGEDLSRVREKYPTAALAELQFTGEWADLAPGCAELVGFVKPRDLAG